MKFTKPSSSRGPRPRELWGRGCQEGSRSLDFFERGRLSPGSTKCAGNTANRRSRLPAGVSRKKPIRLVNLGGYDSRPRHFLECGGAQYYLGNPNEDQLFIPPIITFKVIVDWNGLCALCFSLN